VLCAHFYLCCAALGPFPALIDCTELSLGGRGLEQLAGFERLVNLEVLWLHDNKLSCLNNLDHNIRIRQLYAHNNRLCTLKGSLLKLKFLTHLDVSHNQLKGLSKVLSTLQKLRFLQELNLQVSSSLCLYCTACCWQQQQQRMRAAPRQHQAAKQLSDGGWQLEIVHKQCSERQFPSYGEWMYQQHQTSGDPSAKPGDYKTRQV